MSIANNLKSLSPFNKSASDSDHSPVKPNLSSIKSMPSILSRDLTVEGEINSAGVLEIEGKVKGTIKGNLIIIREEGMVDGHIEADSINIRGKFKGDMKARNISIFKKAKVTGNIEYNSLSVEDGAYIEGQFKQQLSDKKSSVKLTAVPEEPVKIKL